MTDNLAALVMAAGLGTRMRSATPKHLHPLLGRRMVDWVIEAARDAGAQPIVVVASPETRDDFDGVDVAVQERAARHRRRSPRRARDALGGYDGDVLVLSGDTPLLTAEVLRELIETHRREQRGRDGSLVRAARSSCIRTRRPRRRRPRSRGSSRPRTRRPTSSSCARSTPPSMSSRRQAVARARAARSRTTRRASST